MTRSQRRKEILWYLLISFGFSWLCWTPVALSAYGVVDLGLFYPPNWYYDILYGEPLTLSHGLTVLGGFGPILGALIVARSFRGQAVAVDLIKRVFDVKRSSLIWYLVALFGLPILYFLTTSLGSLGAGSTLKFGAGPLEAPTVLGVVRLFFYSVFTMTVFIVVEEMGWRGFLLRWLQSDMSALRASLWLALVWAYWHLPYYILLFNPEPGNPDTFSAGLVSTLLSPLGLLPITVFMTWVFNSARGSLLVVMIMHGANNTSVRLFGAVPNEAPADQSGSQILQIVASLAGLLPYALVVALILIVGAKTLSRQEKQVIDPAADC